MTAALLLNRAETIRLLDKDALPDVLAEGFRAISADPPAAAPPRNALIVGEAGRLLTMSAFVPGLPVGTKLVTIFPANAGAGLPSHLGLIVLMDPQTGAIVALMDGTYITAMRTAGAAVLAARMLARPDSHVVTILGAGVQGRAHLDLLARHLTLDTIFIGSRDRKKAARLASRDKRAVVVEDYEAAVRASDIVCLCSGAGRPLVPNQWVRPGQHISSVGYAPPGGELDPAIAARAKVYVEARAAFAPPPAGCAELAGIDPAKAAEIGDLLLGRRPGRESADDVTVYKAMGHAVEDLVVANLVYRNAVERASGRRIDI